MAGWVPCLEGVGGMLWDEGGGSSAFLKSDRHVGCVLVMVFVE